MMVNPRYSCCYIPVGVTVFISSLLSLILSSVAAGMFFWFIHTVDAQPDPLVDSGVKVTSGAMIGMIIAGVVFVGIAVISLFGFIGSVIRNRRMVKAYSILVWICFLFWLPLAGFTFALSFPPGSLIRCYRDLKEFPCGSAFDVGRKTSFLVSNVLGLLIELYICIVTGRYVEQLKDERANKKDFGLDKKSTSIESNRDSLNGKH